MSASDSRHLRDLNTCSFYQYVARHHFGTHSTPCLPLAHPGIQFSFINPLFLFSRLSFLSGRSVVSYRLIFSYHLPGPAVLIAYLYTSCSFYCGRCVASNLRLKGRPGQTNTNNICTNATSKGFNCCKPLAYHQMN